MVGDYREIKDFSDWNERGAAMRQICTNPSPTLIQD